MITSFSGKYFFLSNFFPHRVIFEAGVFPTNEHAFQAAKVLEPKNRVPFMSGTASNAKRLGRQVDLPEDWNFYRRYAVMRYLVREKFSDPHLAQDLLETGDELLVEGNTWHDKTWGAVQAYTDPEHVRGGEDGVWLGHNLLGYFLMEFRNEIRELLRHD